MSSVAQIPVTQDVFKAIESFAERQHIDLGSAFERVLSRGLSAVEQEAFFEARLKRTSHLSEEEVLTQALAILDRAGAGNPPMPGDEISDDLKEWVESKRAEYRQRA